MQDRRVPLEEIFRVRKKVGQPSGKALTSLEYLQNLVRTSPSLSLLELETMKEMLGYLPLSRGELLALENMAQNRATLSQRTQGWHAGFGDLVKHLEALRAGRAAA